MKKDQLFKKHPTNELFLKVINSFGLSNVSDTRSFSRKDLKVLKTVEKIEELKSELNECYLPCKSRTYLNDLTPKNVITILRQVVKNHGYEVYSREKYIRGDKFIIYQLIPREQRCYRPVNIETNFNKQCIVRFD